MQEKDVVTIAYFEDPIRFADLINGFVFHGEQKISPEDITELNRVITKIWRKSGWLRAQMLIRDLARQVQIGVGAVDYPMKLLEVRTYQDLDDFQTDIKYVFGILQNTRSGNGLKQYVEENCEHFENLEEDAYDVISMMSHSKELEVIKEHHRTERGGINMCKAIKELIAEGVSQGIEQGIEQGMAKGIERGIDDGIALMKAVLRLHAQGFSDTQIAKKCGISVEKVKYILDDAVA